MTEKGLLDHISQYSFSIVSNYVIVFWGEGWVGKSSALLVQGVIMFTRC